MGKKEDQVWDESKEEKPKKKKRSPSYSRNKGNAYELKLVKELKEITKDEDLCTARSESKKLDNAKIDIADPNNTLDFYVQAKATQNTPQVKKLNAEVGKKDKPLVIFWNAQEKREVNIISVGEYVILQKEHFYDLLKLKFKD